MKLPVKTMKYAWTLAGLFLALAVLWLAALGPKTAPRNFTVVPGSPPEDSATQPSTPKRVSVPPAEPHTPAEPLDYRRAFRGASDYFALAQTLLPAAKAGDREAQYYLWKTDHTCHTGHQWLIAPKGQLVSLDDALASAASNFPQLSRDEVRLFYQHCSRFYSQDAATLGNPAEWLERATEAGEPRAEAETAAERLEQERLKLVSRAGGATDPATLLPPIGGGVDPRDLLRMAVQTGTPEVLSEMGTLQAWLNPTTARAERLMNYLAWTYLACQQGLDCSDLGEPIALPCAATGPCTSVPTRLMQMAQYNWAPVAERAQQIQTAINAGAWDQLGLGSGSD